MQGIIIGLSKYCSKRKQVFSLRTSLVETNAQFPSQIAKTSVTVSVLSIESDVNPSSSTSIALRNSSSASFPSDVLLSSHVHSNSKTPSTTTSASSTASANATTIPILSHAHPTLSSSNSSAILNHFNIHNAKLIGLILFFALFFYHGSQRYIKGATSCHRLMNEGRIERYHVWQPTGCMIHWYDLLDFNQCSRLITQSSSTVDKSLIATRKAFNVRIDPGEWLRTRKQEQQRLKQEKQDKTKIDFSYTFVGDERLYMIYRTFINTIKYHSNLSRKKTSTTKKNNNDDDVKQERKPYPFVYKHGKNLTYTNENFILQYYSVQSFDDHLYNLFDAWLNNSSIRPHVLVFGLGLYDGLRNNASADDLRYFEGNLTRIKDHFIANLSLTTSIFWFGQPHLSLDDHLLRFSSHSPSQQNEYVNEFIPKLNSHIDRMNDAARHVFYHTNIYWHSSTLLEEYSSLSNENMFLYDDNSDDYFDTHSNNQNFDDESESNHDLENAHQRQSSSSSTMRTEATATSNATRDLTPIYQFDADELYGNRTDIIYYSYMSMRKNHTILSTPMINSGKIFEFYKLSSFTRHTCVQILLNALCNPLLLPDDGTCCAQVPPLTRLQFLISLILGCSITFFILYIVYRIRSVFILKRKSSSRLRYGKLLGRYEQQQDKAPVSNGHCHSNGAFQKDINDEDDDADEQLLNSTSNGDCVAEYVNDDSISCCFLSAFSSILFLALLTIIMHRQVQQPVIRRLCPMV